MENKPVTIKDIAKKAGVSISTVSRAFNNYADINPETRDKILKIAEELDYVPNVIARSLVSNKNFRVGILIEDYNGNSVTNPMVFEVVMAFKNTATRHGYETILLTTTSDMQKSENVEKLFSEKQLDGAFIMGLKMTDTYYNQLKEIKYPCVLLDISIRNTSTSCIGVDNVKGAFLAVEHLINLGHRRIGFINGRKEAFVSYERLDGYYLALNRYGIPVENKLIEDGGFEDLQAGEAAERLIKKYNDMTAVFCASDIMAIGVINKFNEIGFSIPDDVSVVGFDDIYIASHISPKLTTIRQDKAKIGEAAANVLLNLISGQAIDRVIVEPEIIVRESTKKLLRG